MRDKPGQITPDTMASLEVDRGFAAAGSLFGTFTHERHPHIHH